MQKPLRTFATFTLRINQINIQTIEVWDWTGGNDPSVYPQIRVIGEFFAYSIQGIADVIKRSTGESEFVLVAHTESSKPTAYYVNLEDESCLTMTVQKADNARQMRRITEQMKQISGITVTEENPTLVFFTVSFDTTVGTEFNQHWSINCNSTGIFVNCFEYGAQVASLNDLLQSIEDGTRLLWEYAIYDELSLPESLAA